MKAGFGKVRMFLSFVLAISLLGGVGLSALAASSPTVTVESVRARAGETVTLEVSIAESRGIRNFDFQLEYPEELHLTEVSAADGLCAGSLIANVEKGIICWAVAADVRQASGTLFTLHFQVDQAAKDGNYAVSVRVRDNGSFSNESGAINASFVGGAVTVESNSNGGSGGGMIVIDDKMEPIPDKKDPLSDAQGGEAWKNPFTDVKNNSWYYDAVSYAVQMELFTGTSVSTFEPDGTMTRAMFATVLHRCMGKPEAAAGLPFSDTEKDSWYSDAVAWASEKGYVNGTGNHQFSPAMDISLEQMLTVLYRVSGEPAVSTSVPIRYGAVDSWAADAMAWAADAGLLNGVGGTLSAQGAAARAQVAAILMNFTVGF